MLFNFYTVTAFLNFILSITFAIFVLAKNKKNPKNFGFFIFAMLVGLWSLCYFFWQNTQGTEHAAAQALFWVRALMMFAILIPAGYLHFVVSFTETMKEKKRMLVLIYLFFSCFLVANLTPYFVSRVAPIMGFRYWPVATPLFSIYLAGFLSAVTYSFYLLIRKYRVSGSIVKLQLKYLIVGYLIGFVSGCTNFLPWYGLPLPPVANSLVPAYIVLMAYAVTKYKLMDIKVVLRNVFFYFNIALAAYGFFYAVAALIKFLFGDVFSQEGYLLGFFIAPVFAVIMYSGSNLLSGFINKYFFYSFYKQQNIIKQASKNLSRHADLEATGDIIIYAIDEAFEPDGVAVLFASAQSQAGKFTKIRASYFDQGALSLLDYRVFARYFEHSKEILVTDELGQLAYEQTDAEKKDALLAIQNTLRKQKIFILAPLMVNGLLYGVIAIGITEKSSYSTEDLYLLETLSRQAEVSIENSVHYRSMEEQNHQLLVLLDAKNDAVNLARQKVAVPVAVMSNTYSLTKDRVMTQKESTPYLGYGLAGLNQTLQTFFDAFEADKVLEANLQKTNTQDLMRQIVEEKKEMIWLLKKEVDLVLEKPDASLPLAWCDPKQIAFVMRHLLDNAIWYTQKGTIAVSWQLAKDKVQIHVKDAGMGFLAEDQKNIGQKFWRSKDSARWYDGQGLGMYVSKKVMEANKGALTWQSEGLHQGAVFTIELSIL